MPSHFFPWELVLLPRSTPLRPNFQTSCKRRVTNGLAGMEFKKKLSLVFNITIAFTLTSLANSALSLHCIQKGDDEPVHCCDQREHGGSLICCVGQNSTCRLTDNVGKSCYCDEYCESIGDCCSDFKKGKLCGFGKGKQHYAGIRERIIAFSLSCLLPFSHCRFLTPLFRIPVVFALCFFFSFIV